VINYTLLQQVFFLLERDDLVAEELFSQTSSTSKGPCIKQRRNGRPIGGADTHMVQANDTRWVDEHVATQLLQVTR
jgi:hypothetical protein